MQERTEEEKMNETNLIRMRSGTRGKVVQIRGGQHMRMKLETLGIRTGCEIEKVSGHAFGGPVVARIGATRVAVGHGMAHRIIVEIEDT
jgi:ferrous iron transport protein A